MSYIPGNLAESGNKLSHSAYYYIFIRKLAGMARIVSGILILLAFHSSYAQIVNIESKRMQSDTTGWMGSVGTTFGFIKNVQEVLNINSNAHLQYKSEKSLYLMLANYNLLKGNGKKLSNNMFYHLRYNYKVSDLLRWEVFTQLQQDVVTNISLRILAGTGPRFKLHGSPKLKLYAATSFMYEHEKENTKPTIIHNDLRSSSYISFTYEPNDVLEIVSTTFYQPLYRQIKDFRLFNQLSLNIKVSRHLSLTTGWNYLYDEFPAGNSPRINYSITNGFSYRL